MSELVIESLIFVIVFIGACALLNWLVRGAAPGAPSKARPALEPIRQYSPAIDIMMEYRGARMFRTLRRVRITRALRHHTGRLYLLGFYEAANRPRTFRLDRVICFASLDGEVLDTQHFVSKRLELSPERTPAPARNMERLPAQR